MGIRVRQNRNPQHLSDEQLALLHDGVLSETKAAHIESCLECAQRLRDIQRVVYAYAEYEQVVHTSILPPAPKPWMDLSNLVAGQNASRAWNRHRWSLLFAASAAACVLLTVAVVDYVRPRWPAEQSLHRANELLARSSRLDLRPSRPISVRARGKTFIRPAVLAPDAQEPSSTHEIQMAFVTARYSWQDPLNARSFSAWRSQLGSKRDSVSVVERNDGRSYRVRTETTVGILRTASLTLRATDLQPTAGSFEFDGLGSVALADEADAALPAATPNTPPAKQMVVEMQAGPEDTLRVLAALNSIGADVGEPIDISEDVQHRSVVVHASGLSADRAREVSTVLTHLPRVVLVFDSSVSPPLQPRPSGAERYSTDTPESFRQQLEQRFGGVVALQEATDRVLDESSSSVAQAHAMQVLARAFPPNIETRMSSEDRKTLNALWLSHVDALDQTVSKIKTDLGPLIQGPWSRGGDVPHEQVNNWQAGIPSVVISVEATDKLLNRLLAGSYSLANGEEMLRGLPMQIGQLETAVRMQRSAMK
jgi:hypothetical protein